jgi:hypothetical protein
VQSGSSSLPDAGSAQGEHAAQGATYARS